MKKLTYAIIGFRKLRLMNILPKTIPSLGFQIYIWSTECALFETKQLNVRLLGLLLFRMISFCFLGGNGGFGDFLIWVAASKSSVGLVRDGQHVAGIKILTRNISEFCRR